MVFLSSTLPPRATAKRKHLGGGWEGGVGSGSSASRPLGGASGSSSLCGRRGSGGETKGRPPAGFLALASSAELILQWHVRPIEKNRNLPPSGWLPIPTFPHDNLVCRKNKSRVCFLSFSCPCAQRLTARHSAVS